MEMQVAPIRARRRARPSLLDRLLADRRLWKITIYSISLMTYLCSVLFFALGLIDAGRTGGSMTTVVDLAVALYFLVQVIFLFVLSGVVERRHQPMKIDFPDRRKKSAR
jgi:hypothetical protein